MKRDKAVTAATRIKAHLLIVEARFYADICDELARGAIAAIERAGATWERHAVPGSLEIPGAIVVAAPAFLFVRRNARNALGEPTELPDRRRIDAPLLAGAITFGVGWGLVGICPGPGIALLASRDSHIAWFVGAMLAGMLLAYLVGEWLGHRRQPA